MKTPPESGSYPYDVALSFAGEQRAYVEAVAKELLAHGVSVFYDKYETAMMWGKNLYDHLADVYANQALYVVVFASADYAAKAWTNHERQSAQARAMREKREYILPARFDETAIPGMPGTIGYVDCRDYAPAELARLVQEKLSLTRPVWAPTSAPVESPATMGHSPVGVGRDWIRCSCGWTGSGLDFDRHRNGEDVPTLSVPVVSASPVESINGAGDGIETGQTIALVKRLLASPDGRIPLGDVIEAAVQRARAAAEGPLPVSMTTPEEFRDWLSRLAAPARELAVLFAAVAYWGQSEQAEVLVRSLARLTRWKVQGGIVVVLNSRLYAPLVALYGAGVSSIAAGNYPVLARLLRARLPHAGPRQPGDEETAPTSRVLNAPAVLDHVAMNQILNIGAERRVDYYTPASVFLQQTLAPILAALIPSDEGVEAAFDTFEALLAMRYIADGGYGVPTGQYAYRGHRSFVGRGVPERLAAEIQRDDGRWPPIASGLFDDTGRADEASGALLRRLSKFQWD